MCFCYIIDLNLKLWHDCGITHYTNSTFTEVFSSSCQLQAGWNRRRFHITRNHLAALCTQQLRLCCHVSNVATWWWYELNGPCWFFRTNLFHQHTGDSDRSVCNLKAPFFYLNDSFIRWLNWEIWLTSTNWVPLFEGGKCIMWTIPLRQNTYDQHLY